uniref:Protein low PSII accumulation 3 like n=1 Tax=Tanacetum cinerariifolium TaxID=118510 RepID=A0A6L2MYG6_TANCI|nr:protein low PSII accumulation 3 like [Tanacetum cinerariifolium]
MASLYHLNPLSFSPSSSATKVPKLPSSSSSFLHTTFETCGYNNGISYHRQPPFEFTTYAKFDKFDGPSSLNDNIIPSPSTLQQIQTLEVEEDEDDSCLPSDLEGAVRQSSEASAEFVASGGMRAIVELLIPQLQFLDDEGAQAELWELSRIFVDTLIEETGCERVKAIFPDAGAAALLKYNWNDATFGFASLSDRKPVDKEDEIVVMVLPDYQMLEYVERIASTLSDDPPRPLIMWNPRLISEEVGIGFNVRKLRKYFLRTFTTVYSMKPLPTGAVFRCYPGLWKVFFDDKDRPNRYILAKEMISRPDSEDIDIIFGGGGNDSEEGPSMLNQAKNHLFLEAITLMVKAHTLKRVMILHSKMEELTSKENDLQAEKYCNGEPKKEAQKDVKVEFLSKTEAWDLFTSRSGLIHNDEIELIAKAVCENCGGLPLAIITVGRALRKNECLGQKVELRRPALHLTLSEMCQKERAQVK